MQGAREQSPSRATLQRARARKSAFPRGFQRPPAANACFSPQILTQSLTVQLHELMLMNPAGAR